MATITIFELAKSRNAVIDLRAGSTTFQYLALVVAPFDVSDDQDLIAYLLDDGNIPNRYGFQLKRTVDVQPQGGPVWLCSITYGFDEGDPVAIPPGDPLPYEFTFDTTGGTQHITQSLDTRQAIKYGIPAQPAPVNYNRAIGVSRDGVAGTDVVAPKLEFQLVRNFQGMTLDYIRTCHMLTGSVNDAPFYGYDAGELLFLGASGAPSQNNQANADPLVRVTFRFAGSPNKQDIDLVPDDANGNHLLRVPSKGGWEYLWVFYKDDVDAVSKTMRPRPDAAYVEQVYQDGDFGQLLIGE